MPGTASAAATCGAGSPGVRPSRTGAAVVGADIPPTIRDASTAMTVRRNALLRMIFPFRAYGMDLVGPRNRYIPDQFRVNGLHSTRDEGETSTYGMNSAADRSILENWQCSMRSVLRTGPTAGDRPGCPTRPAPPAPDRASRPARPAPPPAAVRDPADGRDDRVRRRGAGDDAARRGGTVLRADPGLVTSLPGPACGARWMASPSWSALPSSAERSSQTWPPPYCRCRSACSP